MKKKRIAQARSQFPGKKRPPHRSNGARARRDYKETLFRMLFSDRENLLSLYNAVNQTGYTDASALRIPHLCGQEWGEIRYLCLTKEKSWRKI